LEFYNFSGWDIRPMLSVFEFQAAAIWRIFHSVMTKEKISPKKSAIYFYHGFLP